MNEPFTEGEASDLRHRLRDVEAGERVNSARMDVHEEKCAGRYRVLLMLGGASIALNFPSAWPHIMALIGLAK